jgi:arabinose-5-phosphate isomerase
MVMGDIIAVCLMELKQFSVAQFAQFHPGGNLGKKLTLTTQNLAESNSKPAVRKETKIKEVIIDISKNRLGATAVVNDQNKVEGIITDGDIRRMLETHHEFQTLTAKDIYHKNPITIAANVLAIEAAKLMEQKDISQIYEENESHLQKKIFVFKFKVGQGIFELQNFKKAIIYKLKVRILFFFCSQMFFRC